MCLEPVLSPAFRGLKNALLKEGPAPKLSNQNQGFCQRLQPTSGKYRAVNPGRFGIKDFGIGGFHHSPSGESMQYRGDVLVTGPVLGSSQ